MGIRGCMLFIMFQPTDSAVGLISMLSAV